jgi:D-aspartate ligase
VAIAGVEPAVAPVRRTPRGTPPAVVMGDVDLVRALGLAGIRVAFFGPADASARYSRHVRDVLPWIDPWHRQDELVAALLAFARGQREAPILYPQTDAALLLASRRRDELGAAFRFMLAGADLVEELVDKGRFEALARRTGLPVPRAARLRPQLREPPAVPDLAFPLIVKPVVRDAAWASTGEQAKAIRVGGPDEWERVWPRLADGRSEFVVQELVPGPETAIESYHAYVDAAGAIAGEFTGRKIRTFPPCYGYSTAVEIIDLPDVARLGREVFDRVGMRGVAKADFKRDERGRLHLLEINPRFTLWEHPAAIAGVNLAALVHADLSGQARPAGRRPARRVAWCMPLWDARAASAAGVPPRRWLRWALACEAKSGLSRDDPLPFLRGTLTSAVRRRLPRRRRKT